MCVFIFLSHLPISFLAVPMSFCRPKLFPNKQNFISNKEHNRNKRKRWFLVLGTGLFTLE